MAHDLIAFQQRLKQAWLTAESGVFQSTFEHTLGRIRSCQQSLGRPPVVLVCEPHPASFLGYLFACIALDTPVFLTNPQWQRPQWQQVAAQITPDLFLGAKAFSTKHPKSEYSLSCTATIMIPTGGSAGNIKFAIHTWATLTAAVQSLCRFLRTDTLSACCTLPLYHVSGLMQAIRTFATGGLLQLTDYATLQAAIPAVLPQTNTLSLVPTQLQRLLHSPSSIDCLKPFDKILLGGAAAHPKLIAAARQHGLPIILSYGTTETAAMIAAMPIDAFLPSQPIAGTLLPDVKINTEHNIIKVRTPSLCLGIYPELFPTNIFWATGDEGYLNTDGKIVVLGRNDRLINTGGKKVDPKEVETALLNTTLIAACLVVPQEDLIWGQRVVAIYVRSDTFQSCKHLKAILKASIPAYQVPKVWVEVTALPLTSHGKPDHRQIAQLLKRCD